MHAHPHTLARRHHLRRRFRRGHLRRLTILLRIVPILKLRHQRQPGRHRQHPQLQLCIIHLPQYPRRPQPRHHPFKIVQIHPRSQV